jgi:hypothetical protein
MNSIDTEIQQLQSRIAELEKIKKEEHIKKLKNHSLHHRYYDTDIYIHLKASYDLFRIFNKRLDKLEILAQKYKEKLI